MHRFEARRCQASRSNLHLQEARDPMLRRLQALPLRPFGEEDPLRLLEGGPHGRTLRQEGRARRTNARIGEPLLRFRDQGSPTQVLRSCHQRTLRIESFSSFHNLIIITYQLATFYNKKRVMQQ